VLFFKEREKKKSQPIWKYRPKKADSIQPSQNKERKLIEKKYSDGKLKRTLKKELKEHETV